MLEDKQLLSPNPKKDFWALNLGVECLDPVVEAVVGTGLAPVVQLLVVLLVLSALLALLAESQI